MKSCLKDDQAARDKLAEKSVRFNKLRIQKHPIILGDNPSVTYGPPVSIDWESFEDTEEAIEEYESNRPRRKVTYYNPTRHRGPPWILLLSSQIKREEILKSAGYSDKEVRAAEREVARIQRSRWMSQKWYFHPFRTVLEIPNNVQRNFQLRRIDRERKRVIRESSSKKNLRRRSSVRHSHTIG